MPIIYYKSVSLLLFTMIIFHTTTYRHTTVAYLLLAVRDLKFRKPSAEYYILLSLFRSIFRLPG